MPNAPFTLSLLRHAKSSRDDQSVSDHDRPLTQRGRQAAISMGREIARRGFQPQLVLCSPARRAQETWDLAAAQLSPAPAEQTVAELYDFGDGTALLDLIHTQGGAVRSLMLVGHNPSMENLADRLCASGGSDLRNTMATKFPTAALAVISFDQEDWSSTTWSTGNLSHFICPRDLPAQ